MTATRRTEIGQGSASFGIAVNIVAETRRQVSLTIASMAITRNRLAERQQYRENDSDNQ